MSLADDISREQPEQLAVLYCDVSRADTEAAPESEIALWRVNYFRAARELAADHGGHEATTASGGWVATFTSTVEALVCARALSSLVGRHVGGPSLSAGLSAGEVTRGHYGIGGNPVREAVALCHRANARQVLVADPLTVVVAPDTAGSFAGVRLQEVADFEEDASPLRPLTAAAPAITPPTLISATGGRGSNNEHGSTHGRPSRFSRAERRLDSDGATPEPLRLLTNSERDSAPNTDNDSGSGDGGTRDSRDHEPAFNPDIAGDGVRLTVLGWVQLEVGEPPIRRAVIRGSQARAVVSMLALRRGPVHKDELAELLWPTALPEHWEGALRGLMSKVRRFLDAGGLPGRETLLGEGGYYELRLPLGVAVDRDVATNLIAAAEVALTQTRSAEAADLARRAATILERRLLAGPNNVWFDQVRAELIRDRLAALELCASAGLLAGAIEGAKRAAVEAVELDPYRESSYRLLMQAQAAAGSRGEALRTYERCRKILADSLGVGPAAQTQALYIQLLG